MVVQAPPIGWCGGHQLELHILHLSVAMWAGVSLCVCIKKDTLPMGSVSINGYVWGEEVFVQIVHNLRC